LKELRILRALVHPMRARILEVLWEEPLTFSWIMRRLGLNPKFDSGSFAFHLKVLREAGLVEEDPDLPRYRLTKLGSYVVRWVRGLEVAVGGEEGV